MPSPTTEEKPQSEKRASQSPTSPLSAQPASKEFDLEANRLSPAFTRSLAPSPNDAVAHSRPVSVTSLPVQGINSAPTHGRRRRKAKVRTTNDPPELITPGREHPQPRRANSLPAAPVTQADSVAAPRQPILAWNKLLEPAKKIREAPPTLKECIINTVKYSWLNVMIVLLPVAWAVHFSHMSDTIIFVFSFLSIVPLAALLGFATEELAIRVGPTLGGLLNATFGNAVELIIAILALVKGELKIVQASMLGSVLSNCLLVLGMCFLAGGVRFHEQGYGVRLAQQQISLLSLSIFSIVVPAAFSVSVAVLEESDILAISRATAIILLICYMASLFFQLWTHAYLFTAEAGRLHAAATFIAADEGILPPAGQSVFRVSSIFTHSSSTSSDTDDGRQNGRRSENGTADPNTPNAEPTRRRRRWRRRASTSTSSSSSTSTASSEEEEEPKLTVRFALILLLVVTVITGVTAEFLVDSISGLTSSNAINQEFVALILLPLVGNAAEHVTAVTVSVRNKLDLAMTVAIGSSIQIALFVLPLLVILGWIIGQPLSLQFDVFETIVIFLAVIIVNYAIADGRTNWLEGFVLMVIYVIIAVSVWYYEGKPTAGSA